MATVKLLPVMALAQGCWSPNLCSLLAVNPTPLLINYLSEKLPNTKLKAERR